jgi:hypothetical protein
MMIRPERRGRMCRAAGRKHAVEIDVDRALPALVGVVLDRAGLDTVAFVADPRIEIAHAGIDSGVGEADVDLAMRLGRSVERAVEGRVVGDIHDLATNVVTLVLKPNRFLCDAFGIDVEQCRARAVFEQRFGKAEAQSTRAAGDDDAMAFHAEQVRDLHGISL